jgi:hypothetical protein
LKDKRMNILPGNMRFGAGQSVKRLEDQRLLAGRPPLGAKAAAE